VAMRTKEQRMVVVMVDADELEWAAENSKCGVPEFIAMAVADAIFAATQPEGESSVDLVVDGKGMTITHSAGGLGAV
jgi:hypothetical protein